MLGSERRFPLIEKTKFMKTFSALFPFSAFTDMNSFMKLHHFQMIKSFLRKKKKEKSRSEKKLARKGFLRSKSQM